MVGELERALRRGARRTRKLARIGGNAHCAVCGENDWRCLELHEPSGSVDRKPRVDMSVVLCRNCHAKASDLQYDHPRQQLPTAALLLGFADLIRLLAERLEQEGEHPRAGGDQP
jgi:hypothetical protein